MPADAGPARDARARRSGGHLDVIAEIETRLHSHPEIEFEKTPTSIEVAPRSDTGFPVALLLESNGFLVHYAGWHEHFELPRDALNCFSYGLFGECRLRVTYRGSTAHRWTLEHRRGGRWIEESTTRRLLFPFWRRPRTLHLQNRA